MSSLPDGVLIAVAALQVLLAVGLFALMVALVRAIHRQGGTVIPKRVSEKIRSLLGRK